MKKFNNCRNVIGNLIKKHREEKHYTKTEVSHKLELLGIELDCCIISISQPASSNTSL